MPLPPIAAAVRFRRSSAGRSAKASRGQPRGRHQQVQQGASRERVLADAELVKIWNAAPASDYGRIVKLLMLTGQRRDEIANLRWSEVGDDQSPCPRLAPRTPGA